MNISAHIIIVLTVVCLIAGVSLVYMNQYAEPLIKINVEKATREAIFKVLPGVTDAKKIEHEGKVIFKGLDEEGKLVGYAFVAQGSGYQGLIKIMTGIDANLEKLTGIDILESVETPGLGAKITKEKFRNQFDGVTVLPAIEYVKGKEPERPNEIQAITGATVSSRSVVKILNATIAEIREIVKDVETMGEDENE
ncbi:MAG: FMN-binding protein [Candidatus Cloacimonadota bacterium]|nr:MAG: FMN-binding protein [Candidatus Cloacimonadota bacterium]